MLKRVLVTGVLLALVSCAVALTMTYRQWGYVKYSLTENASASGKPSVEYTLQERKRWDFLPGQESFNLPLSHEEFTNEMLNADLEPRAQSGLINGRIAQTFFFKR